MKILIRSAKLFTPGIGFSKKRVNVLIKDGIINQISDTDIKADKIIEGKDLKVSPGWFDMNVFSGDPGFEHKEDIDSLSDSASAGGFTGVLSIPNTKPVVQTKDVITYIKSKSEKVLLDVYPSAAVTIGTKGEELTEMIDLHRYGAVAFSDGDNTIWHSDILLKALQYNQKFDGLVIQRPEDRLLSAFGQMNEGKTSTIIGLKGIPTLAEDVIVQRDLKILEYTGGKMHFSLISSPASLILIKDAKRKGLKITCDIPAYLLALEETEVLNFDSNFKVNPPLRTKKDIEFFKKAVKEGVVDLIVSAHRPHDSESKDLEFDLAEFGMTGLETVYSIINTYLPEYPEDEIIHKLCVAPRHILNLPVPEISEGEMANITVYDSDCEFEFSKKNIFSKSKNSAFLGKRLKGKVKAVFNKNRYFING